MTEHLQYLSIEQTMPLMNPQYPPQYYQQFTLLKKHIEIKKYDSKANQLAQWLIPYGQTNYNCWFIKKMCFLSGAVTYQHQMQFSQQTLYEKIKNFQLWEHRRFLLQHSKLYVQQYRLINTILQIQPKNYHAWSHRIWIFNQVLNYNEQIEFTHNMLQQDAYNNSVWSYRSYVISKFIQNQQDIKQRQKMLYVQIVECIMSLQKNLNNQSGWNYLRGYFPSIKLKNIPCENKRLINNKLFIVNNEMIQNRVMQFIRIKLQQLRKKFGGQGYIANHYDIQSEIELLITLLSIQSQHESSIQYAKNTCLVLEQKDRQKQYYWKWVANNL